MKWQYANQIVKEMLWNDPFEKMVSPQLIKENPVRQVFKCGKFFFKIDKRKFNSLKKEFNHANKISAHGIPVVPHLAVSENTLVTLGVENAVELKSYLSENIPDEKMLSAFADFVALLKKSNLRHNDLHAGNVLYIPNDNKFLLVDLCNANIVPSFFKSPSCHYSHLVMEIRSNLSREKLYPLLQICCSEKNPKDVFETELQKDTVQIISSWPKRKNQILSGYGKFTRKDGDFLFSADAPKDLSETIKITGNAKKYMLLHYFLELNHIPHRKVRAIYESDIYLEKLDNAASIQNSGLYEDFCQRLFLCGINSAPEDWKTVSEKSNLTTLALQ
jgi:hypothetical protein